LKSRQLVLSAVGAAAALPVLLLVLVLVLVPVAGGTAAAQSSADRLTVYAAASLTEAFGVYDRSQSYSFAASNLLETQIRNGAPADLFASAAPANTQRLYAAGIVLEPVTFTANRLALIVPKSNPAGITAVSDLAGGDVKLVIANATVPVGAYTRALLKRMGLTSVLASVVSEESDVKAVTGKVALGQADAGFVYVTDVRAVGDQVAVIPVPASAQPRIRYEIAVVKRSGNRPAAKAWIAGLLSAKGQRALRSAGFQPLPKAAS
jgi:molybdate transport system substrate-binding protein